eukprot:Rmarinus@m.2584
MKQYAPPDSIASAVLHKFKTLPRKGKPNEREWTILAAICATKASEQHSKVHVLALGAGTKCLPGPKVPMSTDGLRVLDSHAEVLTRRSFVHFLHRCIQQGLPWVESHSDRYRLAEGVRLYMYISQCPCGDASIFPLDDSHPRSSAAGIHSKGSPERRPRSLSPTDTKLQASLGRIHPPSDVTTTQVAPQEEAHVHGSTPYMDTGDRVQSTLHENSMCASNPRKKARVGPAIDFTDRSLHVISGKQYVSGQRDDEDMAQRGRDGQSEQDMSGGKSEISVSGERREQDSGRQRENDVLGERRREYFSQRGKDGQSGQDVSRDRENDVLGERRKEDISQRKKSGQRGQDVSRESRENDLLGESRENNVSWGRRVIDVSGKSRENNVSGAPGVNLRFVSLPATEVDMIADKHKVVKDYQRTGARLVCGTEVLYSGMGGCQATGWVRTKPGRASGDEPSKSMSCSDKLAAWAVTGLQGSLLSLIMDPVYVNEVIVGEMFHAGAMARALSTRVQTCNLEGCGVYSLQTAIIHHTSEVFAFSSASLSAALGDQRQPVASGFGLCWHAAGLHEVVIGSEGTKQGTSTKKPVVMKKSPAVSKAKMFEMFLETQRKNGAHVLLCSGPDSRYCDVKRSSASYQLAKRRLKEIPAFSVWESKSSLTDSFSI